MSKKEAIVDTCFFNKLSNYGKNIETFRKVLMELDYKPVVHPYIAEKELDVFPNFDKLVEEGFIRKVEYSEFIEDEDDKELYAEPVGTGKVAFLVSLVAQGEDDEEILNHISKSDKTLNFILDKTNIYSI